jgi:hypothetical protein
MWQDARGGTYDVYAQKVNGAGAVQWIVDGIAVCAEPDHQYPRALTSDGAGGAIMIWTDLRGGSFTPDILAQRVDASGSVLWSEHGVVFGMTEGKQGSSLIVSDGVGGAIIPWTDDDDADNEADIYAQRLNGDGVARWGIGGVALCTALGDQRGSGIASDGEGGAIVAWSDERNGDGDIYAQKVNASGSVQWTANGIAICTAAGDQLGAVVVSDGAGGAILAWAYGGDIFVQRVDASGILQWIPEVTACTEASGGGMASDGEAGAIVVWADARCENLSYIFAQRVRASGEIVSTLLRNHAATLAAQGIRVDWSLSEMDDGARFSILRASAPEWRFIELEGVTIEKNGLSFTWTDESCLPGSMYKYRVECEVEGAAPRILFETEAIPIPALPLTLYQNHPNPFNPRTAIRFYLPETQEVFLDIYDVAGKRVARLAEGRREKGFHEVVWDGRNSLGTSCSTGVYFSRLKAGKSTISRKMVLLR